MLLVFILTKTRFFLDIRRLASLVFNYCIWKFRWLLGIYPVLCLSLIAWDYGPGGVRQCGYLLWSIVSALTVGPQIQSILMPATTTPLELFMPPPTTPSSSPSESTSGGDSIFWISLAEIVNPAAFAISEMASAFSAFLSFSWRLASALTFSRKALS